MTGNMPAQRVAAWCGPAFLLLTGLGFVVIAGFVPPIPPSDSATQVAERFLVDRNSIRAGLLVAMFGSTLLCPWYAVTGLFVRRIAGPGSPWTITYLLAAAVNVCAFLIPYTTWQTAAFRPDRTSPELTQRLDDLAWIPWIGLAAPAVLQGLVLAAVILSDRRTVPVLPRWVGYLSALSAISLVPPTLLVFFTTGPFAWNGLAFYISLTCWPGWVLALSITQLRALRRPPAADPADPSPATAPADLPAELAALRRRLTDLEAQVLATETAAQPS